MAYNRTLHTQAVRVVTADCMHEHVFAADEVEGYSDSYTESMQRWYAGRCEDGGVL